MIDKCYNILGNERIITMRKDNIQKMILAAMFLALAYVMPFLTLQIPQIGQMLCPLHIPVLICGFICGWKWGLTIGFIVPLLRSLTLSMPPMYPSAIAMAFELATYGAIAGLMFQILPKKKIFIYVSLLISMLVGRIIWGSAMYVLMDIKGNSFTFSSFLTGAIINSVPGIIIQIILVPIIVMLIKNKKLTKV